MKITKSQLKQLIKEELEAITEREEAGPRHMPIAAMENAIIDSFSDGKIMIKNRDNSQYLSYVESSVLDGNIVIEVESVVNENCGPAYQMEPQSFQDQNVKVWQLLTHMGLTPQQIDQVKDVLELNKAEAEVEDSFGIKLENKS